MCHTRNITSWLFLRIIIEITSNLFGFFRSNHLNDFLFLPFVLQFFFITHKYWTWQAGKHFFSHSISKVVASHPDLDLFLVCHGHYVILSHQPLVCWIWYWVKELNFVAFWLRTFFLWTEKYEGDIFWWKTWKIN